MLRKLTLAAARGLPREVIGRVPRDGGEPCLPAAALGANRSAFSQMRSVTSEKQSSRSCASGTIGAMMYRISGP